MRKTDHQKLGIWVLVYVECYKGLRYNFANFEDKLEIFLIIVAERRNFQISDIFSKVFKAKNYEKSISDIKFY